MGSSVAKRTSKTGKKSRKQTEAEIEAAALEQLERITGGTNDQLQGYIVEQLINRHGVKLLTLFARQQETLDKHQGKGQQKVTVEDVNVEAGGWAVVGPVHMDEAPHEEDNVVNSSTKAKRKTRKTRRGLTGT